MELDFSSLFNAVRPARGFEDIAFQIQQAITEGQLRPGDRLPNERDLCDTFGVSRPTLREAIRVLETTGVVEVRRGTSGGTFIKTPNSKQVSIALEALLRFRGASIDDLVEFRANFEAETAQWAAKRATDDQVNTLLAILQQLKKAVESGGTWDDVVNLDIAFHEGVATASHNQIRVAIMLAIHGVLHKSSIMIGRRDSLEWRQKQVQDIDGIVEAIANRNEDLAFKLMKEHVVQNVQVGLLEREQDTHQ